MSVPINNLRFSDRFSPPYLLWKGNVMRMNLLVDGAPKCLQVLVRCMDFLNLPEPKVATEYSEGPLSFVTCGFAGLPDSYLRAMLFRPIESEEWLCHVRLTIRPCSAFADIMEYELDFQSLSDLLRGTGVRTIDTAGTTSCTKFMATLDENFMSAFRSPEGNIKLTEDVVVFRAKAA